MNITGIQTVRNVMPKKDPTWRFALGAFPDSRGLVVKLPTDTGYTGVGYVGSDSPFAGGGADFMETVLKRFEPCVKGQNPFNMEKILGDIDRVPLNDLSPDAVSTERARMRARSAIDMALHDLAGLALNVPVYQLLGGLVREEIPVIRIMALKEPAEMAAVALDLRNDGYKYMKIKLDGNSAKDVERVKRVRDAVGPKVHLTVDANQSYSPEAAVDAIGEMAKYGVELVEQPVAAGDIEGLVAVSRKAKIPIEAHESVDSPIKVFNLAKSGFSGYMNVSVTLGGLRSLKTVADICKLAGVKCVISCVGTRILSAASMHFVAASGNIDFACQVGEFSRFNGDPASGLEVENGMLRVPHYPGLGVQVNV